MTPISIHAPLRERPRLRRRVDIKANFNPRSLTGATFRPANIVEIGAISIHAPLRERRTDRTDNA